MFRNQVTKFFISWSYETMSANDENLTKKDMKITNEFTLKQNSNGQYNWLVFKNLNEKKFKHYFAGRITPASWGRCGRSNFKEVRDL
jgi:hypothetical protein